MGKVEKVIVLSVLFVIALILVVSLTLDDPLKKSKVADAGAPPAKPVPADTKLASASEKPAQPPTAGSVAGVAQPGNPQVAGAGTGAKPAALLSATIGAPPVSQSNPAGNAMVQTPGPALPAGSILKSTDGLEDSILADVKLYTWRENDSWRRIANQYYGDWQKFPILKRSNEGRMDVKPGEKVFVPVFDSDAPPTVAKAPTPEVQAPTKAKDTKAKPSLHTKPAAGPTVAASDAKHGSASAKSPGGKKVHVVKDGETLWKIAKEELGSGSRYEEIYELNKDKLASSKAPLRKGWELYIP